MEMRCLFCEPPPDRQETRAKNRQKTRREDPQGSSRRIIQEALPGPGEGAKKRRSRRLPATPSGSRPRWRAWPSSGPHALNELDRLPPGRLARLRGYRPHRRRLFRFGRLGRLPAESWRGAAIIKQPCRQSRPRRTRLSPEGWRGRI